MKFFKLPVTLFLAIFILALSAVAGNETIEFIRLDQTPIPVIIGPMGTDDPQPDTILYDDDNPTTLLTGPNNIWVETRFTPAAEFELRSVYILPLNQNNNQTDPMTIIVTADSAGFPAYTPLAQILVPAPIPPYSQWIDVNLTEPLLFEMGEDFHILYSNPAGQYPSGEGWWPFFDNNVTMNRSHYSTSLQPANWTNLPGDLMIRAGGEYAFLPEPVIGFSDTVVTFDEVVVGDTSWFDLTVFNTGFGVDLILSEIEFQAGNGIFGVTDFLPGMIIAPANSANLTLYFTPPAFGDYEDVMLVHNNTANPSPGITLLGSAFLSGLNLNLLPHDSLIMIAPGGGSFYFDLFIENEDMINYNFDFWTDITLPGGVNYPIIQRPDLSIGPFGVILREDLIQFVPAPAVAGFYSYNCYLRDHNTWELLAQDSFPFQKLPGDEPDNHNMGWSLSGWEDLTAESSAAKLNPESCILYPPSPNPFNPETLLSFELQNSGFVTLAVYDLQGRMVAALINGWRFSGHHQIEFNASQHPSGVYFLRLRTDTFTQTQKLLLIK